MMRLLGLAMCLATVAAVAELPTGEVFALEEAETGPLDAVEASVWKRARQAVDISASVGESADAPAPAPAPAAPAPAPAAPAPAPAPAFASGSAKPNTLFAAKVNSYVQKIKKVEALKKQHWLGKNEQQLASKLVQLDDLEKETPEERKIEKELRVGVKGTDVELSLRKLHEHRRQKKKEQIAKEKAEKHAQRMKTAKDLQFAIEQKAIKAQLKKYRKLSVSPKLEKQLVDAKRAVNGAIMTEKKNKGSTAVKKFAKDYRLHQSVTKNADYPKGPKQAHKAAVEKAVDKAASSPSPAPAAAPTPPPTSVIH